MCTISSSHGPLKHVVGKVTRRTYSTGAPKGKYVDAPGWRYERGVMNVSSIPPLEHFMDGWEPPLYSDAARLIPHVLHQSWKSATPPSQLERYISSWLQLQPDWRYAFHSDTDNAHLVADRYPWLSELFLSLSSIQRADVSRLLYMHAYGGVYADLDVELLQPLEPLFEWVRTKSNHSAIIGQEPLAHAVLLESKNRQCCNAVLAAARGHPFFLWAVMQISQKFALGFDTDPVGTTGPRMLEELVQRWQKVHERAKGGLVIVEPTTFFPTWDPTQESNFREKCAEKESMIELNSTSAIPAGPDSLQTIALRVCDGLRRDGFKPKVPTNAFTNHHWVHTWLNDVFFDLDEGEMLVQKILRWTRHRKAK